MQEIETFFKNERHKLSSFIFRLTANVQDTEDIVQDTMITALEKHGSFQGQSSLKTWVFSIASNKAMDLLRKNNRWAEDVMDLAKQASMKDVRFFKSLLEINQTSPYGLFEMKEHISLCFDCIAKTLPIEQQVALLLKDVYSFQVSEIASILEKTVSQVKHYLENSRKSLNEIFDRRCALINKKGVCNQCTELNAIFNPKQDTAQKKMELKLVREQQGKKKEELYRLRSELIQSIDPLNSKGHELHQKHLSFICEIAQQKNF